MNCRLCGNGLSKIEVIRDCVFEPLSFTNKISNCKKHDITLYHCSVCDHYQTQYELPNDFYNTYNSFEGAMQYQNIEKIYEQRLSLLKKYSHSAGTLIDIGCGYGKFLTVAKKYFSRCIGVEPSDQATKCIDNDILIIQDYFTKNIFSKIPNFSAASVITAFQVFEHLENASDVLKDIYEVLEPGGIALINVPNGRTIVNNSLFHQITCEHINYYTPYSISKLARDIGFEILNIDNEDELIELTLYIRKPSVRMSFGASKEKFSKFLIEKCMNKVVSIWGAGAKSRFYISLLNDSISIKHLFDNSDSKMGLFVSGIKVPIQKPEFSAIQNSEVIIIFASSYNDQIITELRNKYFYKGEIVYFDNNEVKVDVL